MYELAAIGAALSWTIGILVTADLARNLGGVRFNRIRNTAVFILMTVGISASIGWQSINAADAGIIFLSGFIGIAIGDSALFATMRQLGPRRTQILFATNAPMTLFLSIWVFGERLTPRSGVGVALVIAGVFIAIAWGKHRRQQHAWESTLGSLRTAIILGLLAALAQSIGIIIIKPVLDGGAHPIAVTALRIGIAALALNLMFAASKNRPEKSATRAQITLSAVSGLIGMALGMSLLLYAFSQGDVGIATILSSITPVVMLPLLWLKTRERPAWGAWAGSALVVVGTSLIVTA